MRCAGIDRWRGGWIVAECANGTVELSASQTIDPVREHLASLDAVAIDMPIALVADGRRDAEAALRSALGSSARSVFTSPTRYAVGAATQAEATILNREHGGPGISAQAFGLFASIREVRSALNGRGANHWWETHPETAFALMNNGTPMASKRSAAGVGQRLAALNEQFSDVEGLLVQAPPKVPVDDVLDALAALWSAQRIAQGTATLYGPDGRDEEGFSRGIRV